jgi:hypothetical protein
MPPSLLYRYRTIDDRLRQILIENELYFASFQSLNDPFEYRFSTSVDTPEDQRERIFRKKTGLESIGGSGSA